MPCSWIGELDIVKIEILKKEKKKISILRKLIYKYRTNFQ